MENFEENLIFFRKSLAVTLTLIMLNRFSMQMSLKIYTKVEWKEGNFHTSRVSEKALFLFGKRGSYRKNKSPHYIQIGFEFGLTAQKHTRTFIWEQCLCKADSVRKLPPAIHLSEWLHFTCFRGHKLQWCGKCGACFLSFLFHSFLFHDGTGLSLEVDIID